MKRVDLQISGNVQGVNFRYYLNKIARQAGLTGWVQNSPADYNVVEAVLEGNDDDVQRVIDWCRKGPPRAKVGEVKVQEGKYTGEFKGFEIKN